MKVNNTLENLNKFISTMEVSLGMNVSVNGSSLKELPLYDFLLVCQKAIKGADRNQLAKYSWNIMQFSRSLSYLNERLTFANEQVLDFQLYDNADVLCCFFLQFQEHRDIENFKKKELSSFIKYIEICEERNSNLKKTLSYRTVRLFLTFVCMGFHTDASVVCQFVRNQFWISEGFNPRSKLSTSERVKILNSVKSERFKYSKKFKDKMKTAINNVVKHTEVVKDSIVGVDAEFEVKNEELNSSVDEQEKEVSTNPSVKEETTMKIKEQTTVEIKEETNLNVKSDNSKPTVNYGSRKVVRTTTKVSDSPKVPNSPKVDSVVESKVEEVKPDDNRHIDSKPVDSKLVDSKPVTNETIRPKSKEPKFKEPNDSKLVGNKPISNKVVNRDVTSSNIFNSLDLNTEPIDVNTEPVNVETKPNKVGAEPRVGNKVKNIRTSSSNTNKQYFKGSSIF